MKIGNNRALAAEKKAYEMPSVIMTQIVQSSTVLMGSPGGIPVVTTPIEDGEGGQ